MLRSDELSVPTTHRCFACSEKWAAIGADPVCPECGSQAIVLEHPVECGELRTNGRGSHLEVVVDDDTPREIEYHFAISNGEAGLTVARFGGTRLTPQTGDWGALPIPIPVRNALETGLGLSVAKRRQNEAEGSS